MTHRGDSADYALLPNQIQQAMAACTSLEERVIIGVPLFCGLRVGELAHLNASWLTQDGNLRIPAFQACDCISCRNKGKQEWKPKTKAGARTLPIASPIRQDLLKFLQLQPKGLQMHRVVIHKRTKGILKRAGVHIKGVTGAMAFPHALRATCLTILATRGLPTAALAYFAGWSNINIASHYVDLAQAKSAAIKGVREIFG